MRHVIPSPGGLERPFGENLSASVVIFNKRQMETVFMYGATDRPDPDVRPEG
ncbi:hypothetical protein [Kitasatospora sp. NPDC088134]|uniref:hypothetical protein n=1 Tax=Kitasatospora sp. NPDC088134 TaxID=3364071 RepID=UPI0037F6D2FA